MPVPTPYNDQQIADQITRDGLHWGKTSISYSFNNNSTQGNDLDSVQIEWIEKAIAVVEEYFDLSFAHTNGSSDITFNGSSGNGTYASTSYWLPSHEIAGSNIFFDQTWSSNQSTNLDYGSYGFTTIMHEFLHSLGLDHPGDYNAGDGGQINYLSHAEFLQDTHRFSVMSYFNASEDNSGSIYFEDVGGYGQFIYPQTPMVYDILAMTNGAFDGKFGGYGANTSTRSDDTVYGYNATANINEIFDFSVNAAPVLTLYDTGGNDTLDLSGDQVSFTYVVNYDPDGSIANYTWAPRASAEIDLREGHYSSTHGMVNNIGIAFGTVIENAVGTQFNDTIYGNDADNRLDGGISGDDILYGEGGNDFLVGGAGVDQLFGGSGDDTIVYDANDDWTNVHGGEGFDTLLFEMVWYSVELFSYGFERSALHLLDVADALWNEIYQYYNTLEELTESLTYYDDGGSSNTVFDVEGQHDWSEWTRDYDASGNLISETFSPDDGLDPDPEPESEPDPDAQPVAALDENSIAEEGAASVFGNLVANDAGGNLSITHIGTDLVNFSGTSQFTGATGTLTVDRTGEYTFTLHAESAVLAALDDGEVYQEVFEYTVENGAGQANGALQITVEGSSAIITGTSRSDRLDGTSQSESIDGLGGNDRIYGNDGNDTVLAGGGNDRAYGGEGNDTVYGNEGNDRVYGDQGDDTVLAGSGNDRAYGGSGNDTVFGNEGNDRVYGDEGDDTVLAGSGNDRAYGGSGNDTVYGDEGGDRVYGDDGDDTVFAGSGNDRAYGGRGNDTVYGGDGNDRIYGDDGDDIVAGGNGSDKYYGGRGHDIFVVGSNGQQDYIYDFRDGEDKISLSGTGYDFEDLLITGRGRNSYLQSEDGQVNIRVRAKLDTLDETDFVTVDAFETDHNDVLIGSDGNDALIGGKGEDILAGGLGADILWGGEGSGVGDGDKDIFVIDNESAFDIIGDFEAGIDQIDLTELLSLTGESDLEGETGSSYVAYDAVSGDLKVDTSGADAWSGKVVANLGTGLANETIMILFEDNANIGMDMI